jgi:hypothetical protein
MRLTNHAAVPVYTVSGSSAARQLPEHLARKRKRGLKKDPEYATRIELLQDFEFEEASCCVRVSPDGLWVMSTGKSRKWSTCFPSFSFFFFSDLFFIFKFGVEGVFFGTNFGFLEYLRVKNLETRGKWG